MRPLDQGPDRATVPVLQADRAGATAAGHEGEVCHQSPRRTILRDQFALVLSKKTRSGRPRPMDEAIDGETDANRRVAAILEGVIGQSGCSRPIQRQWLRAVPNLWRSTSLARAVRW